MSKQKTRQRVKSSKKTRLKSKLNDLRAFAKKLQPENQLTLLVSLNAIVSDLRTAWIEASNLRDRVRRNRL